MINSENQAKAINRIKATLEWEINTCNNRDWESVADSIICALEIELEPSDNSEVKIDNKED